jgi:hypothetical protein
MNSVSARRNDASPNKINFDKHSPFTDRTHLRQRLPPEAFTDLGERGPFRIG